MKVEAIFDKDTFTLTYIVHAQASKEAIIIDPVLDFDPPSGRISESSITRVLDYLKQENLTPVLTLETHVHADHLSGAQVLKRVFPSMTIAISERICEVQKIFSKVFNLDIPLDGSQFDLLIKDHQTLTFAGMNIREIPTPGHTPACSSYLIGTAVFTGDALFMPDYGVGRCDFPGGSATKLYESITKNLFTLPDEITVYVGHDYQPNGRELAYCTTIGTQKKENIALNAQISESEFVTKREARDKTLSAPRLLLPSIQVNMMAGHLPEPESNGVRYLKLPLKIN